MKHLYTFFLILTSILCSAQTEKERILSRISFARYSSDTLHNNLNALNIYNEIGPLLTKYGNDSLRLAVETERIALLERSGDREELLNSLNAGLALADSLEDYTRL